MKSYLQCNFLICKCDAQLELQADEGGPDGFWSEHFRMNRVPMQSHPGTREVGLPEQE